MAVARTATLGVVSIPRRTRRALLVLAAPAVALVLLLAAPLSAGEGSAPQPALDESPLVPISNPILTAKALDLRGERLLDEPGRASVDAAEAVFESALEVDPYDGDALAGKARVTAIRLSRRWIEDDALIDEALDLAKRAVTASPGDARAHAALAVAGLVAEDSDLALDEAAKAWEARTNETPAWVAEVYAQSLILLKDRKGAMTVLDRILAADPARFQSHYLMGNAQLELGDTGEAITSFRRAVLLAPDFPPALLQLARAMEKAGNGVQATQAYATAIRRFPEEKNRVLLRMAASLIGRGKYSEAMTGIDQVEIHTKRGLGAGTVLYMKALCLEKMGKPADAAPLYRKVIDEYPQASYGSIVSESLAASSYEALARLEMKEGRHEEAVRLMEEAMSLPRPSISLFTGLATVYADYGFQAEALRVLSKASALDFGPRKIGLKTAIYVAWARIARSPQGAPASPMTDLLAALDRDAPAIRARGDVADFLEAARACAVAGDAARGLSWIRTAVDQGYRSLDWIGGDKEMASLARERGFDDLRREPRSP